MIQDVQNRIVKVRNELKAQKVASELAYSAMLWPENAPTITYSGSIDLTTISDPAARVAVTFTRDDGLDGTPYVDLAIDSDIYSLNDWVIDNFGDAALTGRDRYCDKNGQFQVYVDSTTNNSVTYYIDVTQEIYGLAGRMNSTAFSLNITAISPVSGLLSATRLI